MTDWTVGVPGGKVFTRSWMGCLRTFGSAVATSWTKVASLFPAISDRMPVVF